MENQNPTILPEINTFSSSADQPQVSPTSKTNLLLPIIIAVLISGAVFGLGGYHIGSKLRQFEPAPQVTSALTNEDVEETATPSPIFTEPKNKISLSEALSQFCLDRKISIDKLPFTLNQAIKTSYNIQSSINCFVPDENYASMSIRVENSDFSGDVRNVFFFHKDSKYMGMSDNFQSLSNYKTVNINGQNYWLNVREPGPYGISSLGIWVDLIGEKQDLSTGTILRIISLDILKDQQSIDLVKKYGFQVTSVDDSAIYSVSDPTKKEQFIDEVARLAPENNALKASAQNISSDLNGVSF